MIILAPADILRVTCSASGTVHVACHYTDKSSTQNTPGMDLTAITNTTPTAVTTAPAIAYQKSGPDTRFRHVSAITVANAHASTSQDITVEIVRDSTAYRVIKATVAAGAKIQFNEGIGWGT